MAGFAPTSAPRQNTVCTGTNDLVLFTPQFGAPLPPATSATAIQVVLDPQDRVVSLGAVGGALPPGDSAIQAIGTQAAWISTNVHVGARLGIDEQIRTSTGVRVPLTPTTSIASAGPMLLRGRTAIDAVDEGVLDPATSTTTPSRPTATPAPLSESTPAAASSSSLPTAWSVSAKV